MCRIDGPFKRVGATGDRYRLRVVDTESKKTKIYTYLTQQEAEQAIPILQREYSRPVGVELVEALGEYRNHLITKGNIPSRGPNRERTVGTTMQRLGSVFGPKLSLVTGDLTPKIMMDLWGKWAPDKAVDTALNTLAQVRTFLGWLEKKQWAKGSQLAVDIEVDGKRKKGKPKLTRDEADTLVTWCLAHPAELDSAIALTALWMGIRASEIVERIVKNLDGKGSLLDITSAKTEAGVRILEIPTALRPLLGALAQGKGPNERLFGQITRKQVYSAVHRACVAAGVSVVGPHGLRGTHGKLSREVGVSGTLLARAMGHESETTTTEHYAGREAVQRATIDRVSSALGMS